MGFFKKSVKGEGLVEDNDGSSLREEGSFSAEEEAYMRMFMKIARDFVHAEDFFRILEVIIERLNLEDEIESIRQDISARQRAEEYKHFLETNQAGSDFYPDIIDLDKE